MPIFPTAGSICQAFSKATPFAAKPTDFSHSERTPRQAREELYSAWSVAEDAQQKAMQIGDKAANELSKASSAAQAKTGTIELYTPKYYAACTFGGMMACGITHTAVTPLDLVKCRLQVDKSLYRGNFDAWRKIGSTEGIKGIFTGWGATFLGYSVQGAGKYGFYEFFKKTYSDLVGEENAQKYKTWVFLAGSASAEFLADIGLCPFEAVKVRIQTTIPPITRSTIPAMQGVIQEEGIAGLYKGIYPLWGRQIPYTMMKFASFETVVEMIYARMGKPKNEYGKGVQTTVSFVGGYIAGIACAIISHPADVMVSKLNTNRQRGEGFGAAIGRIYKDIGFMGLWNGLPVRIVMIGTLTGLQWLIYDSFKIFMGLPTTGGGGGQKQEAKK